MPIETSVIRSIHALRQMTVSEMQTQWLRLNGEPTRSKNRDYLYRRLAWRIQELQHGGLSRTARDRIDELAPPEFTRARTVDDHEETSFSGHAPKSRSRRSCRGTRRRGRGGRRGFGGVTVSVAGVLSGTLSRR